MNRYRIAIVLCVSNGLITVGTQLLGGVNLSQAIWIGIGMAISALVGMQLGLWVRGPRRQP